MADFAGFSPQDLAAYFGIGLPQATALIQAETGGQLSPLDLASLRSINASRFQPGAGGPDAGFGDITWGLQHLAEHPMGSTYHGDFNVDPVNLLANIATGGLYGLGQGLLSATQTGKLSDVEKGFEQLGPWGSATYNIPQYGPQIARTGNLIGAGAGIGAGVTSGGLSPSGFGAEASGNPFLVNAPGGGIESFVPGGVSQTYYPGSEFLVNAPGGGIAQFTPGGAIETFGGVAGGAGAGAGATGGSTGALLGASAGQQLASFLGGASPLALPGMGGQVGPTGQLTAQQKAAMLSALQSEAHRGLAPKFEARMGGQQESPGIAALRGLAGGM